jgi:hypothetical protein
MDVDENVTPKRVAASEFDLLTVARALVGQVSAEAVEPLLNQPRPMAEKLGPTALGLLKQTLERGAILELCRRGGWRDASHLNASGEVIRGRLWQRRQPEGLRFSPTTVSLLRWLVSSPLSAPPDCAALKSEPGAAGDQLALYLACDLVARCDCGVSLARSPAFRSSPLCWLGFPELLGKDDPPRERELSEALDELVKEGGLLLEALQQDLARRWFGIERSKRHVASTAEMIAIGRSQELVIESLCRALERHDRKDLIGFLLEAAGRLLRHRPRYTLWVEGIRAAGSLSERQRAFVASGAMLRALEHPRRWVTRASSTRFFDDDYDASQLLLGLWEQLGSQGAAHAEQLLQRLQALDAAMSEEEEEGSGRGERA